MESLSSLVLEVSYNWFLVVLSFLVAVFGSFTSLQLMRCIKDADGSSKVWWIITAAFAFGGGAIWTMHFIGMIAYQTPMDVGYDPVKTAVSLAIVVSVVAVSIYLLSKNEKSKVLLVIAGIITGLGVAVMHYAGMWAMVVAADLEYDIALLSLSIVVAIVAATAALWLAFNLETGVHMISASVVMGVAVCGMHYTGMAALKMVPNGINVELGSSVDPLTLGLFIFCFSMMLLVFSLIVTLSQLQKRMYEELEKDDDEVSSVSMFNTGH